jgi:Ca2+-binding EF-hand superfamily protein
LTNGGGEISREEVVVMVNIGSPTSEENVLKILSDATQETGIDYIDMVYFEVYIYY